LEYLIEESQRDGSRTKTNKEWELNDREKYL
jgi:hypothetical protein